MIILAGDVGGTKTLLQLFAIDGDGQRVLAEQRYGSPDYPGLAPIVRDFLAGRGVAVDSACFGVPGPVQDGRFQATNLPWELAEGQLQADLGIARVRLINDFVAAGYGLSGLTADDLVVLNPGTALAEAPVAVLGAGTGLGEAVLYWAGEHYAVLPSEGGHVDFAPRNVVEIGLLRYLLDKFGRVSYERVLSGPGLVNIYAYLRDTGVAPESDALRTAMAAGDAGAAIGNAATSDPLCARAVELFVEIYGAEAGNLALKILARGGVYLAGGVATHLVPHFRTGRFRQAFVEKGRMGALLEGIPVYLVTNSKVGLLGAAAVAARNR